MGLQYVVKVRKKNLCEHEILIKTIVGEAPMEEKTR